MARAKPSNWQPAGIELFAVSELYPDAYMHAVVGLIGDFAGETYHAVADRVLGVAAWLNVSLHDDCRPTAPKEKAALAPLAARLAELRKAFAALDPDTSALLIKVAGRAPCDMESEPRNWPGGYGDRRYSRALDGLEHLDAWTREALAELPAGKKGRKSYDHAREAAYRLLGIWQEFAPCESGKIQLPEPTLGPFVELLREATRPIFEKYGMAPELTNAAKAVLYGAWRPAWASRD